MTMPRPSFPVWSYDGRFMTTTTRARAWCGVSVVVLSFMGCGDDSPADGTGAGASVGGAGASETGGAGATGATGAGGSTGGSGGSGGAASELLTVESFHYEGAFRIPSGDFGASSADYAAGPIAFNPAGPSLFLVGHAQQHPIAEFTIPRLVASTTLSELEMAAPPTQGFVTFFGDVTGGNPQAMDSIGGMLLFEGPSGPELIVNAYEYYDAPADNTHTTVVFRDATDLAGSAKDGWFALDGGAHASGWMSAVPEQHQAALGGAFITGHSSGVPIISRLSVGPSAFVFDPAAIAGGATPGPVATTTLLDFSLDTPLAADLSNDSGQNDLWTHLSRAAYGFIPPGSRTYVTLGHSGGHASGVCYKCTPVGSNSECGGYCANDAGDYSDYYWLWDVDDLVAVKNGTKAPHEVLPYEHGPFPTAFDGQIAGGAYDAASGLLYLNVLFADDEQGTYAVPPLIVAYSIR